MVEQHQPVRGEGAAWIRRFPGPATNGMPLICFPHAGGAASYFRPLSLAMAPDVQVLAVQYPGRQERSMEPCVGSIAALADGIAGALPGQVAGPYAFFGQSMGGVLAFEVARRLQPQAAGGPEWLLASACRAPSRFRGGGVHLLDDTGLVAQLRRLEGTDDSLLDGGEELLAMILPAVRADYQAIETYSCAQGPPLTCPVTALVGEADERRRRPAGRSGG